MSELYERDFHAWTEQQAALLRAGHFAEADLDNLVEEIESMGRSERSQLTNRLTQLVLHLSGASNPTGAAPTGRSASSGSASRSADTLRAIRA